MTIPYTKDSDININKYIERVAKHTETIIYVQQTNKDIWGLKMVDLQLVYLSCNNDSQTSI